MTDPDAPAGCMNCESPLHGVFCADCGQSHRHRRLRLRNLLDAAIDGLTNLDGRLWHTVIGLTLRPGRFCAAYVDGRRVSRMDPFKYFLLSVAIAVLVAQMENLVRWGYANPSRDESLAVGQVVTIALMPLMAGAVRVLFGGRLRSYADDLVFCYYLIAHHALLIWVPLELLDVVPARVRSLVMAVTLLAYFTWAATTFFTVRWYASLWRILVALVVFSVGAICAILAFLLLTGRA